jgi:hypothetical protein
MMFKTFLCICVVAGSLFSAAIPATCQEIVHALTGTVSSVNADGTITMFQDNGSKGTFKVMSSSNTRISFDKKVAEEAKAAKEFKSQGAYVIVFYFGTDDNRTAVAVKTLGAGPFSSASGEVTNWNGHEQMISLTDKDGAVHSFKVGAQTIAETYRGVVNRSNFDIHKGDRIRLVSAKESGIATALFIRQK